MRSRIIYVCFLALFSCRNSDIDFHFDKMGYDKLKLFVFLSTQKDSTGAITVKDTIGLFCSRKWTALDSEYLMQWEFLTYKNGQYCTSTDKYVPEFTGVYINDSELYIHPPRECYRILQFCPHPYFMKKKKIGSTWKWDLDIGKLWSTYPLYLIEKVENFNTTYIIKDTVTLRTSIGYIFCYKIVAVTTSRFGTSSGIYYLNDTLGLIRFEIKTVNKVFFDFMLLSIIDDHPYIKIANSYFAFLTKKKKDSLNIKNFYIYEFDTL